jgi:magnesium chelatase family protein
MRVIGHDRKRVSGPLLDRINIHTVVPRVQAPLRAVRQADRRAHGQARSAGLGHASSTIRERVEAARERQRERFVGPERVVSDGDLGGTAGVGSSRDRVCRLAARE